MREGVREWMREGMREWLREAEGTNERERGTREGMREREEGAIRDSNGGCE